MAERSVDHSVGLKVLNSVEMWAAWMVEKKVDELVGHWAETLEIEWVDCLAVEMAVKWVDYWADLSELWVLPMEK